ncbi:SDR family oxidoreductase [Paludibaculum fermentans]|uniref:SDR family oxidoreductase n=1 Tax=Paludibaculum fermentans TaxID=1473598 RepID=A0A7S7SNN8_PALFE|nr:SDR family oxidoreductase [Paludibaculum fermentans]QOY90325.1 SDR family oxidoreductase [Paludibaculum fermentans]
MGKILVTGASGNLGKKTLRQLLKRKPASELVALVRDPEKGKELAALGIAVHQGDYLDAESLRRAFTGVEKVMLTSTHAFTDRKTAHANVINAAAEVGTRHIVYMPINRKPGSTYVLQEVTEEDIFTEKLLQSSGLVYTLVKHPPFLESISLYIGLNAPGTGVRLPEGNGKFTAASRDDLAEAHAVVLTEPGHENRTYSLTGTQAVSFPETARILSEILGKHVPFIPISEQEFIDLKVADGLPGFVSKFMLGWVQGMGAGEWSEQGGDLEKLIGRKPQTVTEYLRETYGAVAKTPASNRPNQDLAK